MLQATLRLPPGRHTFKYVLAKADGQYHWDEGDDQVLDVPEGDAASVGGDLDDPVGVLVGQVAEAQAVQSFAASA